MILFTLRCARGHEFEGWFRRAELGEVQITWRNRNSWRGFGRTRSLGHDGGWSKGKTEKAPELEA